MSQVALVQYAVAYLVVAIVTGYLASRRAEHIAPRYGTVGIVSSLCSVLVLAFFASNPVGTSQRRTEMVWENHSYNNWVCKEPDGWKVVDKTGTIAFNLVERQSTPDYVDLYNPKRNVEWRLTATKMLVKKNGSWAWLANGQWKP